MKDHKMVGLESRLMASEEQVMLTKQAVASSETSMQLDLEHYVGQVRGILSNYQSLEHTRVNITKTLIIDAIDSEEELLTRKLELLKALRKETEQMDARKDVNYFIKSNAPTTDPWQKISGNVGRIVSSELWLDDDEDSSSNPMYNGVLPKSSRARLRSTTKRPDSLQVNRHASERVASGEKRNAVLSTKQAATGKKKDELSLSWDQFHQQYSEEQLDHPDLPSPKDRKPSRSASRPSPASSDM